MNLKLNHTLLACIIVYRSVSSGLNEVRCAHDDEQQSARPGARREARAAGRTSREGACRNLRPDAPNKNYTIVNKRQTIRFTLLQCYSGMQHVDYRKIYA